MRRAGAPNAIAISAGCIIAPTADISFGAIDENPAAVVVGTDLQMTLCLMQQGITKAAGNRRYVLTPANLCGLQLQCESTLVLHEPREYRYLQPGIELCEVFSGKRSSAGTFFDEVAEKSTKFAQSFERGRIAGRDVQLPMADKGADPARVVETFREIAEAVPELTVDQVEPGCRSAKAAGREWIPGIHGNEINSVDTLHITM